MPRPTAYKSEYVEQVFRYALLGATKLRMAELIGVTEKTFDNWGKKHPEFFRAIKEGRDDADAKVSDSLYHRALGYEYDEQVPIKIKKVMYEQGKRVSEVESVVMKTVHRVVPPDNTSMIFWLKNRQKEKWRDRQEVTGADGGPIETNTLTYMPKQLKSDYFEQPGSASPAA